MLIATSPDQTENQIPVDARRPRADVVAKFFRKVRYWHLADIDADAEHVRFTALSGHA